jgi:inorganic pyrophosphatase
MNNQFTINVFVEVTIDSRVKYEINPDTQELTLFKILPYKFKYPFNYGSVPNTVNTDGQMLDAAILLDEPLQPGSMILCKIIGGLEYKDEKGLDNKLIVCPANEIDARFVNINNISDLKMETLNKIRYFFHHYKDNLSIDVYTGSFLNRSQAIQLYLNSK